MKTTIEPINDKIVVKLLEVETRTKTGIILPEKKKETEGLGIVIACGKGRMTDDGKHVPLQVKKNDTIFFSTYAAETLRMNNETYYVLREDQVLGIIKK